MAAHDGYPHGYGRPGGVPPAEDDSWHDAPGTEDDGLDELAELDEKYLRTLTTPAFDLGPQTESFVVDLTASVPVTPRHASAGAPDDIAAPDDAPAPERAQERVQERAPERAPEPAPEPPASGLLPDLVLPDLGAPSIPTAPPAPPVPAPPAAEPEATMPAMTGPAMTGPEVAWSALPTEVAEQAAPPPATAAPTPTIVPSSTAPTSFAIPPVPIGSHSSRADTLTADTVLRQRRPRPQSGWRKGVYSISGGKLNLGLSRADRRRLDLIERARTPVAGCHLLAVISLKGGVGKTTTTAALGAMFADLRGDRVIAVDANPDRGTLAERIPRESGATVRHLLDHRTEIHRYADVRAFTSQAPTRLEVLASDADPRISAAFSERDYCDTIGILERFYNLVLTDCGTGLLHDAMRGILGMANSLVVVSSASLDGARSASATLDWLEAHQLDHLAKNAVVVISSVRPGGGIVDVMQLEEHFASRCRDVVTIPYDPHLEAGGVLELDELDEETRDAYRQLAAAVGEAFASRR